MSDDQSKHSPEGEEQREGEESPECEGESSTGGVQLARQPQAKLQSDNHETQPSAEDGSDESRREDEGQGTSVQRREEEGQGTSVQRGEEEGQGTSVQRMEEKGQGTSVQRREEEGQGTSVQRREEEGQGTSVQRREEEGQGTSVQRLEEEGQGTSVQAKREERMRRLRELHLRRNEARKLNHTEVVEEDRRSKLPANWEARKRKAEWEAMEEEARKQAEEAGEDYEHVKLLETSASELERLERKKKRKNPDTGFADYEQAQFQQYQKLTRQMEPDMEAYEKQKQEMGDDFYPGVNSLGYGGRGKVSQAGIDRMVADLGKQIEKRSKFSRRRAFNEEADVDYINERNMKFNKKAARFYDKYTAEIKQNLERGTAV